VKVTRSPFDRRATALLLTQAGEQLCACATASWHDTYEILMLRIGRDRLQAVHYGLNDVSGSLKRFE
jgi:DNA-binding MarR family transcriptional regulator